ncbi:unnamed protein product, partial [Mycena citricolor]
TPLTGLMDPCSAVVRDMSTQCNPLATYSYWCSLMSVIYSFPLQMPRLTSSMFTRRISRHGTIVTQTPGAAVLLRWLGVVQHDQQLEALIVLVYNVAPV